MTEWNDNLEEPKKKNGVIRSFLFGYEQRGWGSRGLPSSTLVETLQSVGTEPDPFWKNPQAEPPEDKLTPIRLRLVELATPNFFESGKVGKRVILFM